MFAITSLREASQYFCTHGTISIITKYMSCWHKIILITYNFFLALFNRSLSLIRHSTDKVLPNTHFAGDCCDLHTPINLTSNHDSCQSKRTNGAIPNFLSLSNKCKLSNLLQIIVDMVVLIPPHFLVKAIYPGISIPL